MDYDEIKRYEKWERRHTFNDGRKSFNRFQYLINTKPVRVSSPKLLVASWTLIQINQHKS